MKYRYIDFFDLQEAGSAVQAEVQQDFCRALSGDLLQIGLNGEASVMVLNRLWAHMAAPSRRYHSAVHILAMFEFAAMRRLPMTQADRLAVWFHDSVYEAIMSAGVNETASAAYMIQMLGDLGIDRRLLQAASDTIRATANHLCDDVPAEHHAVMDLDLAGLAASADCIRRQSAALRSEAAHQSDSQFAASAVAFLRALLARPRIYRTPQFAECEQVARNNIAAEVNRLCATLDDD